jgi:predicted permease
MESTLLDLRLAARSLAKAPGFTLVAIGTLALGIGANTSIFSLVNAVLLRAPAHVERPDQLVSIYTSDFSGPQFGSSSYPDYRDFRDESPAIADAIALEPGTVSVVGDDGVSETLETEFVTGNYFEMLGVRPALGRAFTDEEGDYASGASVAVLSHGLWLRRFGGDPDVIGETFRASGQTVTVVGVAPEGFGGLSSLSTPDLWVPVSTQALIEGDGNFEERASRGSRVVARLSEAATVEIAQEQLTALASRLHQEYPPAWTDVNGEIRRVTVVDDTRMHALFSGAANGFALLLLTVVGIVLLIVCANVANLTLARASRRGRELAMKVVLGAGRGRIVRQLLAESARVGVTGGLGGVAMAIWLVGIAETVAETFRPFIGVSFSVDLHVDQTVLFFSALVTVVTVFAVGLLPAFKASRPDLVRAIKKDSGEGPGPFRWYAPRHLLVISQVSASLVLLVGAGLALKSLRTALQVDPGFTVEGVATITIDLMDLIRDGYSVEEAVALLDDLEARVARLPGVEATSIADAMPMTLSAGQRYPLSIPGYERAPGEDMEFQFLSVGPGFMAALGMEVLLGREFRNADNNPDARPVLMVNETFAERFWPGESPLGKLVTRRGRDVQVVGLVHDAMYRTLRDEDRPAFFVPFGQNPSPQVTLLARTTTADDAADLLPMMRDEVASIDARLPITMLQSMEDTIAVTLLPQRIASWLLSTAGGLGLLLATVGLYGVVSFLVAQRTREVGVRMALGAEARQVMRMIVGRGLALAAVGAVVGVGLAALVTRFAESFLFEVSPLDVGVFASVAVAALAVAAFASWLPARRAAGVDPMVALRHE